MTHVSWGARSRRQMHPQPLGKGSGTGHYAERDFAISSTNQLVSKTHQLLEGEAGS